MPQQPTPSTDLDLVDLPRRVDRGTGAVLVTKYVFTVVSGSKEVCTMTWHYVNGKAVAETAELFAVAQAKLEVAPLITSVRRRSSQSADAPPSLTQPPLSVAAPRGEQAGGCSFGGTSELAQRRSSLQRRGG